LRRSTLSSGYRRASHEDRDIREAQAAQVVSAIPPPKRGHKSLTPSPRKSDAADERLTRLEQQLEPFVLQFHADRRDDPAIGTDEKDGSSKDAWCIAALESPRVYMSWCCPACRTEVLHIATHQLPDPTKMYRCQACRLNLRFSWVSGKMKIACFQPDHYAFGTNNTRQHRVSPGMRVKRTK